MDDMMKELEAMMSSQDFENMFGGIMEQLMSKDILYEPMKELAEKVMQRSCCLFTRRPPYRCFRSRMILTIPSHTIYFCS
jgi:hypothetical protein